MRALSMALKWMSLNGRTTSYMGGTLIFAEDSGTGRSKCSANGSSCVSIVHIVLRLNHHGVDYMTQIVPVDVTRFALDIHRDLSISPRARKSGPPERIDGMTVGFVSVTRDAPHNGEVHPDGDEILYVLSGKLRVIGESDPSTALDLGPGEACIVRRGEWHRVIMLEPSQLLHITPGPRGGFRPL
jgi:quercetin dioxygenase-like cupin family protein